MSDTDVKTVTVVKTKTPSMWKVILHNDDYTPMEFVIHVLINIFNKDMETAERLMLIVHEQGSAQIGLYTKEIALTKVRHVSMAAEQNKHPLVCTAEEA